METIASDRKAKATGHRPAKKAAASETEAILSKIIEEQSKGMLNKELEKVLENET